MTDSEHLKAYAESNSDEAFSNLVHAHMELVYSAALRQDRDPHLADDVTQAVFIILSRKAKVLKPDTILPAWLLRTTRYAAMNARLLRARREKHERKAAEMASNERAAGESPWNDIAPLLDEALAKLAARDHDAVVLRFFSNKSAAEIGALMGIGEIAARKRVSRAIERLRKLLTDRGGIIASEAALAALTASRAFNTPSDLHATVVSRTGSTSACTIAARTLRTMRFRSLRPLAVTASAALLTGAVALVLSAQISAAPPATARTSATTRTTTAPAATQAADDWKTVPIPVNEAFFQAVAAGDRPKVQNLLDIYPALINARPAGKRTGDWDSATALAVACWEDKPDVLQVLIDAGADLESVDPVFGASALNWAAWFARPQCTRLLLDAGAQVNHPNKYGAPALPTLMAGKNKKFPNDPRWIATPEQRAEVETLLKQRRPQRPATHSTTRP
jgi:RNA polymerase sigma factor (sigma-70 family)